MGETMSYLFPEGLRGAGGPPVYPGAAAYTGAVTHTLSVAVIICELTGQLTPILPVLVCSSSILGMGFPFKFLLKKMKCVCGVYYFICNRVLFHFLPTYAFYIARVKG
uniref:Uncharacterized protein n=1 Tax=Parascaris equorum TaxID=6256 RepID=A0A914RB48_PAREQ